MAYADPRKRSNVALNGVQSLRDALPAELSLRILLSNGLLVLSLPAAKSWLLERGVGSLWLTINVIAGGGIGVLVLVALRGGIPVKGLFPWLRLVIGVGLLFLQQATLFHALERLSALRVLLLAPFLPFVSQILSWESFSQRRILKVIGTLIASLLYDSNFSFSDLRSAIPAYLSLVTTAACSVLLERNTSSMELSFASPGMARLIVILGTAIATLPLHVLGRALSILPPYPEVPLLALLPLPLLAASLLFLTPPTLSFSLGNRLAFTVGFIPTTLFSTIVCTFFTRHWPWMDFLLAIAYFVSFKPIPLTPTTYTSNSTTAKQLQGYIKTILSNSESSKIFYFLMLNLAFMAVQMLYGVWTNSLGLISDAIHMAFDCMAIGMGLFASVMATWEPNERFTYGYGRIETLSGFANGIFLILISIFIIFEAIERLLEPPEMNTNKLLLVSSIGLGVNLFGMFAMGGHHHHGHSHSHGGHGHSHGGSGHSHSSHSSHQPKHDDSHAHSHAKESCDDHGHSHDSHGHSHSSSHSHQEDHSHGHSHNEEANHGHSHSHARNHSHSHSHSAQQATSLHQHEHDRTARKRSLAIDPHASTPLGHEFRIHSPDDHDHDHDHDHHSHGHSHDSAQIPSPLTPSYSFTHDTHLEEYHNHSHSHSAAAESHSHNMRGVFLHVMADTLGSVGVIISTILIKMYGWTGFDPIASLFIAILIAASVFPLVLETGQILGLDAGEHRETGVNKALREVMNLDGVAGVSTPRFWPMDSSKVCGSIRVQVAPWAVQQSGKQISGQGGSKLDVIKERVEHVLRSNIEGLDEVAVQLDG